MRIVAGTYRSRILKSLKGMALRPTSDRLRETLFNILATEVSGSRFLDLYAGTGAIGIEALSRGAIEVVFVENHVPAAKLIRENLAALGISSGAQVITANVLQTLAKLATRPRNPFDFVYLDPPYAAAEEYEYALVALGDSELVSAGSIAIAEHSKKLDFPATIGKLRRYRVLAQGDAVLSFFRLAEAEK